MGNKQTSGSTRQCFVTRQFACGHHIWTFFPFGFCQLTQIGFTTWTCRYHLKLIHNSQWISTHGTITATEDEIKKAHRTMALKYHPDVGDKHIFFFSNVYFPMSIFTVNIHTYILYIPMYLKDTIENSDNCIMMNVTCGLSGQLPQCPSWHNLVHVCCLHRYWLGHGSPQLYLSDANTPTAQRTWRVCSPQKQAEKYISLLKILIS